MKAASFWVGFALLLCQWPGMVQAEAGQPETSQEVQTFAQLGGLSREEALEGRPVRVRGAVLCYDSGWDQLYVYDGVEARYFSAKSFPVPLESGLKVEIRGTTTFAENYAGLTNLTLAVQGRAPLPPATPLELRDLTRGLGQWVEISGRVRVAEASSGRLAVVIADRDQSCVVFVMGVPPPGESFNRLIGARVRVRGINSSKMKDGRLTSASICAPGLGEVTIIEPSKTRPEQLPVVSIDSLLNRELGTWTNEMVHINGIVVDYEPGQFMRVKDATGVIRINVVQMSRARQDDWVQAWGFLDASPNETLLGDGYFELMRPQAETEPTISAPGPTDGAARTNQTITRIGDIVKLNKEEAEGGIPVRVRGIITYADAAWNNAFLQSGEDAVYVDLKQSDVQAGQWVEVTGQTAKGGFAPEVDNATIRVLGTTNLPFAAQVTLSDLAEGRWDSHWVEMEGVVRRIHEEWEHLTLSLATPRGQFRAVIPCIGKAQPDHLVGALVRVRGACGSQPNGRGQIAGVTLHVPSVEQISIEEAAPPDPFALGSIPIASLGTFNLDRLAGRQVKVSGVITLTTVGRGFYLQDASGGVRVSTQQTNQLQVGDAVEVIGFPAVGDFAPCLEEAAFRRKGAGAMPAAKKTTAEQILLRGNDDGLVVQLDARLLQDVPRSASPRLLLQDGAVIFTAQVAGQGARKQLPRWESGSVLRLTGICSIQGGENHEPAGFRVLVAQPNDIRLVRAPSWWSVRHTLTLVGGLALSILAAIGWIGSLRRQVRAQTDVIRQNHRELVEVSREAGMAEVATSVLHNVGNVLNSVNTSAGLISEVVRGSKAQEIAKVTRLLEDHRADLAGFLTREKGAEPLLAYLQALTEQVEVERTTALRELQELTQNIEHIKEIVAMQQTYAKVSGVVDYQSVMALIDDALRMHAAALVRHQVNVVRQCDPLPDMLLDRHKVLQILVNLISNAKYALAGSVNGERRLILGVHLNGDNLLRISVADNGMGIAPENLTRIFSRGFTTRSDGHGFGLHSGALAAREMGGRLVASSDGLGNGATFTLELPAQPKKLSA